MNKATEKAIEYFGAIEGGSIRQQDLDFYLASHIEEIDFAELRRRIPLEYLMQFRDWIGEIVGGAQFYMAGAGALISDEHRVRLLDWWSKNSLAKWLDIKEEHSEKNAKRLGKGGQKGTLSVDGGNCSPP
jgi:hypothetical protein